MKYVLCAAQDGDLPSLTIDGCTPSVSSNKDPLIALVEKASQSELAIVAMTATMGLTAYHKLYSRICDLVGVQHIVVLITQMEDVGYDQHRFLEVQQTCKQFFSEFSCATFQVIPFSAELGEGELSPMDWYKGLPLQALAESIVSSRLQKTEQPEAEGADLCTAKILWAGCEPLVTGRKYFFDQGESRVVATVMDLKHKVDLHSSKLIPADKLFKNEIGIVDLSFSKSVPLSIFVPGSFQAIFSLSTIEHNQQVSSGVVKHILRRSSNVVWQNVDITRDIRSKQKKQQPYTVWFTGLSGSGKSTIANSVEKKLVAMGYHTMLLDGDNIRHGLNKNLGFKEVDRVENIRRVSELAKVLNDAGIIVLASFIAPYAADRESARAIVGDCFVEVHVATPLEECERRDIKGLYAKARAGSIPNFTGISAPYEEPVTPRLRIDTAVVPLDDAVAQIIEEMAW